MKGQAEQPSFSSVGNDRRDVQEWSSKELTRLVNPYSPALLKDKQPTASIAGMCHKSWLSDTADHGFKLDSDSRDLGVKKRDLRRREKDEGKSKPDCRGHE
jgi:hypothetical protein